MTDLLGLCCFVSHETEIVYDLELMQSVKCFRGIDKQISVI